MASQKRFLKQTCGRCVLALLTATAVTAATRYVLLTHHPPTPEPTTIRVTDPVARLNSQRSVDLTSFCNARLTNSWLNPEWGENNLDGLAEGLLRVNGIVFNVHGLIQLQGLHLIGPRFPTNVLDIAINEKFNKLFMLHGAAWAAPEGAAIAILKLHYDDKRIVEFRVRFGVHVRDWSSYPGDPTGTPESCVAWEGVSPRNAYQGVTARLYSTKFENPRPEVGVKAVDYCSTMSTSAPFILALTVE